MANLYAIKPKPEGSDPKVAQPGTRMFRRSDVMGQLAKLTHYASRNVRVAADEGREDDARIQRARLGALQLVRDALFCLPEFANPAPASAIEAQRAETAQTGSVHESAVGAAETPEPSHGQAIEQGGL